MRSIIFIFIFSMTLLYAQPVQPIVGCHNAYLSGLSTHIPSEEELLMMENSNKRSDSINIINYFIRLDVTQVAAKSITAHTTVSFITRLDNIESITLDLRELIVDSVLYRNKLVTFNYNNNLLVIFFGEKLNKNTESSIEVYYHGVPKRDPVWGGFYFVDKYIYNLGIGLSSTPPNYGKVWFPCFDNFVERTSYDYEVVSVAPTKAYCVGHLVTEDTSVAGFIKRHYRMDFEIPTYLSNIAVSDYVLDRSLTQSLSNSELPIDLIARPSDISAMKTMFANMPEAVDAFEFWFGQYKFERVGFVATTVGAMEHPTNTAYPVSTITSGSINDNEALYAHEFGHQWWGNLTTLDDARDMWIKEGNAEYSSHLFLEYVYGKDRFKSKVKENLSFILFNAHINDSSFLALSPMPYNHTYGTHTYRKGAAMIHNLRAYLGDSLYRTVCHTIFDSLTGKSMNAYEFRDFINRNSPVKVTNYFDDYIFNPGYTAFYIDSFYQSPILSKNIYYINVVQKKYHADHLCHEVPLKIYFHDKNFNIEERTVTVSGESTWVEIELPIWFTPVNMIINEEQTLNYASLQDYTYVKSTGNLLLAGSAISPSVNQISDSAYVNIAHHLVGPSIGKKRSNVLRLSERHFWQVNAIAKGSLKMNGRVEYNGTNALNLDYDILQSGEDSVILVYRKDFTEEWREYFPSTKLKLTPGDKRGFIRIDDMLPGEYSLAYGYPSTVLVQDVHLTDLEVFPNPASDHLTCKIDHSCNPEIYQIYNSIGQLVSDCKLAHGENNFEINLNGLASDLYHLLVFNKDHQLIGERTFDKCE